MCIKVNKIMEVDKQLCQNLNLLKVLILKFLNNKIYFFKRSLIASNINITPYFRERNKFKILKSKKVKNLYPAHLKRHLYILN